MASLTIRNLDEDIKQRLRTKAATSGRSMEEEARIALTAYVSPPRGNLYDTIRNGLVLVEDYEFPRVGGNLRPLPDIFNE